jgi:3-isopropylmalate dehydrogenase
LTDEASVLAGSIGMLPSASIGAPRGVDDSRRRGVYEPIHGSAPTLAGKGLANPVGTILSLAMLLRISLQMEDAARAVEKAVARVIESGHRTPDIADSSHHLVSTGAFGDAVATEIEVESI